MSRPQVELFCRINQDTMALTKSRKREMLAELLSAIQESNGLVFTDFSGSSVKSLEGLRGALREDGSRYQVVKKTLFNKALQSMGVEVSLDELPGNLGVVFATDPVSGAKASADFAKKAKKDSFKIVGGLLEEKILTDAQVTALAKLPSKEQLQGQVVGTIAAPMSSFVNVLAGTPRGLVNVLNAYRDTKQA